jgi:quercetin dioxygenase-like cupin family protein
MLIDESDVEALEVLGPTVRVLTPLDGPADAPCVLRGTIPAGGFVPLHSHPDPETFIGGEGELFGFDGEAWVRVGAGQVFHVPGGTPHAWRNDGPATEMTIVATVRMGRFFREIAGPPTPEALERFAATAARYGHWNASPEENLRIGLDLCPTPHLRG